MAGPAARGYCVRFSGNGRVLVVLGGYSEPICVSTNSGETWTVTPVPLNTLAGTCATSSADGSKWVLSAPECFYISTNYGKTWDSEWSTQSYLLASSADGNTLVRAGEYICTSFMTSPLMSISHSGNALQLSWPSYIAGFAVQTTPDLALTNWANVETTPSFSNGQYQVTLSPTNRQSFFRLRHP